MNFTGSRVRRSSTVTPRPTSLATKTQPWPLQVSSSSGSGAPTDCTVLVLATYCSAQFDGLAGEQS